MINTYCPACRSADVANREIKTLRRSQTCKVCSDCDYAWFPRQQGVITLLKKEALALHGQIEMAEGVIISGTEFLQAIYDAVKRGGDINDITAFGVSHRDKLESYSVQYGMKTGINHE